MSGFPKGYNQSWLFCRNFSLMVAAIGAIGAPAVKVDPLAGELEVRSGLQVYSQFGYHALADIGIVYAAAADTDQIGMRGEIGVVP